jgi:hypothetical protein
VNSIVAYNTLGAFPQGWLNFELSVLRRLKFSSIAFPFTGEPDLCLQLKPWKVRIAANDPMLWAFTKLTALVENPNERLGEGEIATLLDDAYIPRDKLDNPSLLTWFNETDAWWFDNVRFNAERFETPYKRAVALTLGMMVGDYVLSFDEETRQLREPFSLSKVFQQMAEVLPYPYDNSLRTRARNQGVRTFIAERQHTDLMFFRLPAPIIQPQPARASLLSWREEWLRGGNDFWAELEEKQAEEFAARVQSKQQYLGFVEELLRTAAHIPAWAIAHTENGFISTDDLTETIGKIRRVEAVYSKDFSDVLGVRASIVTAGG